MYLPQRTDVLFTLLLLVACVLTKHTFRRTHCMLEVHSKMLSMVLGAALYVLYEGKYKAVYKSTDVYVASIGRSGTKFTLDLLQLVRGPGPPAMFLYPYLGFGKFQTDFGSNNATRIFLSHALPSQLPLTGRFIYVIRNPAAVVVSMADSLRQACHLKQKCMIEDIYFNYMHSKGYIPGIGSIWNIHSQWWQKLKNMSRSKRLWLHYEDITSHKREGELLGLIASIMSVRNVTYHKAHQIKEQLMPNHVNNGSQNNTLELLNFCQSNPEYMIYGRSLLRNGYQATNRTKPTASESFEMMVRQLWTYYMKPVTGFNSYDEMLNEHLKLPPGEMAN